MSEAPKDDLWQDVGICPHCGRHVRVMKNGDGHRVLAVHGTYVLGGRMGFKPCRGARLVIQLGAA